MKKESGSPIKSTPKVRFKFFFLDAEARDIIGSKVDGASPHHQIFNSQLIIKGSSKIEVALLLLF